MASDVLYAKLLSRYIWDEYGRIITFEDILSLTTPISDEDEELVLHASLWLDSVEEHLTIYDKAISPNAIYATLKEWLEKFGEFKKIDEHKEDYIEEDKELYKIVLWDHVGLISGAGTKKERIDLVTDYAIGFRNKCNISGIFIQQMNRNSKSMDRKKAGYELYQLDDFKDTSSTTDASEVVIALYYPYREKIAKCEGYPIQNVLRKRFRLTQVLKNRYGQADVNIGTNFFGEVGMFRDMPIPADITDYEPYLTLDENFDPSRIPNEENYESKEDKNDDEFMFKL